MDHHVGIGNQRVDGVTVEDVALPVFGFSRVAGSNGRRAMPMMRSTSGCWSSASTAEVPISPVGPVTATVNAMHG
jgi:hypothetical protein